MNKNNKDVIIRLENVNKKYQVGDGIFSALSDVNLEIRKGEFLGITGKSGAGKTTLLNMIAGVSSLSSGKVLYFNAMGNNAQNQSSGIEINSLSEDESATWRGKNLGIVYQSFELIPSLNLVENVMFPPDLLGNYHPIGSKEKALGLLKEVEIEEHAYKIPAHISGGQMQRVAIARALINDPSLIIADEPTGNLDSVTAETIFQLFEKMVERGKTVVMVTHDESLASRFSRRLYIADGYVGANKIILNKSSEPEDKMNIDGVQNQDIDDSLTNNQPIEISRNNSHIKKYDEKDYPAIIMKDVDKVYRTPAGDFTALKSIDLQLDYGKFISIVGKSGSGKSTLINMITGIDHPTNGEIIIGDHEILHMGESERSLWRGKNMGIVFQFFQLLPTLTLLENTILPMDYCNIYPVNERVKRGLELLNRVGLEEQAHKFPSAVSSGQQQSAAIARSLATDPSLILADEPTGNLDSKSAEMILSLFEELAQEGKTIIIVTHDPSITKRTDQTIILSDGEIIDETIARALPLLSHPQMLETTKNAERIRYKANEIIIEQGLEVNQFYMIVSGSVDIRMKTKSGEENTLAQLFKGQFFGEVELTDKTNSIAKVQASSEGVELAIIPKEEFYRIIDGSSLTRSVIDNVAKERKSENLRRREDFS